MSLSEEELAAAFRERYRDEPTAAQLWLERSVFGSDFGANGWTPPSQAGELSRRLELSADDRLLDLGTGRGWPGVYLTVATGCRSVLVDRPIGGLRVAVERSRREGVLERTGVVAAGANRLPFRDASFDAVVHTDLLC